jgi:hypothetical protein
MIKFTYFKRSFSSFFLGLGLSLALGQVVCAQTPDNVPSELQTLLQQIETAANSHNKTQILTFYSPNFTNSDGLKKDILGQSLESLWRRFPNLKYETELQSWSQNGNQLIAETVTTIEGSQRGRGREIEMKSTMRSRQYFENQKLVRQEILAEKTQLTSGENPPNVTVMLPEKVRRGERFAFDAIVDEPLGDDVLLGAAIEERTTGNLYLEPTSFDLELLSAGGIFKWVKAPLVEDQRWLSAILVRGDGMTVITQRVVVE